MQTKSEASLAVKPVDSKYLACTLNEKYTKALAGERFRWGTKTKRMSYWAGGGYDYKMEGIKDTKDRTVCIQIQNGGTPGCCGIDELDFTAPELPQYMKDEDWEQLIALYIAKSVDRKDGRVVFVGLPIENTNEHDSQYDFQFYNKLLKTLLRFGFKQIGTRYVNDNSKNKLAVLAGQMPT